MITSVLRYTFIYVSYTKSIFISYKLSVSVLVASGCYKSEKFLTGVCLLKNQIYQLFSELLMNYFVR